MKESAALTPDTEGNSRDQHTSEILHSEAYRRELLQRILRSTPFAKSERLGALLTYLCEMSFKGSAEKLNEQRIGRSVFGRAEDYDSSVDGIVRSQASRLRQRLEQYFSAEGLNEPLRISIPRGSYAPLFVVKQTHCDTPERMEVLSPALDGKVTAQTTPADLKPARRGSILPWTIVGVLTLLLLALVLRDSLPGSKSDTSAAKPENAVLRRFWAGVFASNFPTLIVTPDSGLVMFENFSGEQVGLKDYLEGHYRAGLQVVERAETHLIPSGPLLDLASRRYTSIVDVDAILLMQERAHRYGSNVELRFARDLRPNDLKHGNVVLLGASSADPWVELFENSMTFTLQDTYKGERAVSNRQPQKSEPSRWTLPRGNPESEVFGIVAYRPNLDGDGNALILEGTSMSGTEAALDFIMDQSQFIPFLEAIGADEKHVPHFEVVLTTKNLGASAGHPRILAWRRQR